LDDVKDVMSPKIFKGQDKKGDGKITLQEFLDASFQDFAAADVNKNGALTMEEFEVYFKETGK
jgi:Ca2+-binding EF-hand superfamily protein